MPTAHEHDMAARAFDDQAAHLIELLGPVTAAIGSDVLSGGRLTAAVEATVENAHAGVRAAADRLGQLAAEARRRAQVCRDAWAEAVGYDAARRRYAADLDDWTSGGAVGTPPSPPRRPAPAPSWVET